MLRYVTGSVKNIPTFPILLRKSTKRSAKARRILQLCGPEEYVCVYPLAVEFKWCYIVAHPIGTSLNTEHWLQNAKISLQDFYPCSWKTVCVRISSNPNFFKAQLVNYIDNHLKPEQKVRGHFWVFRLPGENKYDFLQTGLHSHKSWCFLLTNWTMTLEASTLCLEIHRKWSA